MVVVAFYLGRSGKELFKTTALLKNMVLGEGLKLEDIHYRQDDPEDKIKWVLDAEEIQLSEDHNIVTFHDFRLKVDPEGSPGFRLSGEKGNYSKDSDTIELWGNLKGFYGDDYQIFTDHLLVTDHLGRLSTDRAVEIVGPFFTVKGQGLLADLNHQNMKILSNVTTTLKGGPERDR